MRAGLLTETINFLKLTKTRTDSGSEVNTYSVDHNCRARVTYSGGDRVNENGDIFFSHHVNFEIRQGYTFDELARVQWRGKQYRILSIEHDRHNQSTKITTELIND